ncbi:DNA polymerase III subunit gamma/tau [Kaistella sp. 97-N-M2]|uniref:DNA polymerase III subunit gamma/tau n=1 Tax=Kaistella sp. 97-N-M2 TaxID=2908645 RepID=UPI001F2A467E|nr:DNA polymerase III subunit gamma/tau [Kaistella sp. 97-N-M2]UJF29740.1 DNA polymerase III subunit gamma/tau [Kaistella sp. 97-N-M2]
MENFVVSARKYRPQEFDTVVGQSHITDTLEHAIVENQLAQALLFCGPRGVGKTTCARILARKINERDGSTSEDNFAYNIFELDAASNNSVEDIRELTDQVRFAPQVGKFKIYIIDEVHMLSSAAFNAFLKTLEEPPAHAIFILATTEKHKIIPTILSRCQIYDFKRITIEDIQDHLKKIAEKEAIRYEDDALYLIAQKADGALRDALSIFDRLSTFTQKNITLAKAAEVLNILDYDQYLNIVDLAHQNKIPETLFAFNEIVKKGFDSHLFIAGLGNHFRDLMMAQNQQTLSLIEVGDQTKIKFSEQSKNWTVQQLIDAIEICNHADINYKNSKNSRLTVEIALMQLSSLTASGVDSKKKFLILAPLLKAPADSQTLKTEAQPTLAPEITAEVPKDTPKVILKTAEPIATQKIPSKYSISAALQKTETEEEQTVNSVKEDLPSNHFTETDLKSEWQKFLDHLKEKDVLVYNAISSFQLHKKDENIVEITYPSDSAKNEFEKVRADFFNHFMHKVNHFNIVIEYKNDVSLKKEIITKRKIFDKFAEINPVLRDLDDLFKFDFN